MSTGQGTPYMHWGTDLDIDGQNINLTVIIHQCLRVITVPTLSPCQVPCTHASLNALPATEHKNSPTRPLLAHTMLIADFILKAIPPVASVLESLVIRESDTLPSSFTWRTGISWASVTKQRFTVSTSAVQIFEISNRIKSNSYFSIRFDSKWAPLFHIFKYLPSPISYYLTELCQFFTLATTPSNQQNLMLTITMIQVLYLLEVFILAHNGLPNTETPTTTIVRCHKNSWLY